MSTKVKDVMTAHVVAVRENATFKEMAAKLRDQGISAFPVLDSDDKVIGVVSEADMLTKAALDSGVPSVLTGIFRHREQAKANGVTAADLMTKPAVTIGPDEPVAHAARLMYGRRVKRLPVTTPAGRLVGIVSRADALSVYSRPDTKIEQEIHDVIVNRILTDPGRFSVTVRSGIVTVEGGPETAGSGRDMIDEIRHLDGVVAVRDRLSYPLAERQSHPPLF